MKNKVQYYAKSFEEDFILKTLKGKKKVSSQSIENIIKTQKIKPNTNSFGREMRLACSFIHKNYLKTYRSQGLIFTTNDKPDYVYPFDLGILADTDNIIVQYYRIKDNLHLYYNHKLISGFEKFVFQDIQKLIAEFKTLKSVWAAVNKFRKENNHKQLPLSKYKLIEYNEVVFHKTIKVKPIAIFGYCKETRKIARKMNLPYFRNVKDFYKSLD